MDNTLTFLIPGRLSFHQLLLVLTYTCLRFSLPLQINDQRQIQDILRRREKDWEPRVGPEGLKEFRSSASIAMESHATIVAWEKVRAWLAEDDLFLPVSLLNLRRQLVHVLFRIGQISSEGLYTIHIPGPIPPSRPLRVRSSMALIFLSVGVPIKNSSACMLDPDDDTLNEMVDHLNESPVFAGGLSLSDLKPAMSSLELLFSDEEHYDTNFASELVPYYPESQFEVHETENYHYGSYLFGEITSVPENLVAGRKRPSGALVENGEREDIKKQKKCRTEI
jgi:hypothetical protein